MYTLIYWLDFFGIVVFALSGALMAGRYRLDPFGVGVLATVTAIGGGTIRDVVLGAYPVFWVERPEYLALTFATAFITIVLIRKPKRVPKRFLLLADAFGLALFAVLGAQKTLTLGFSPFIAVVMGGITGVAGGMIRDVLCSEIPLILRQEIYATAALLGGGLYVLMQYMAISIEVSLIVSVLAALTLRLAAIYWRVSLPAFDFDEEKGSS